MFVSVIFDIFARDFGESRGFSAFDAIAFFSGRKTLLVVAMASPSPNDGRYDHFLIIQ